MSVSATSMMQRYCPIQKNLTAVMSHHSDAGMSLSNIDERSGLGLHLVTVVGFAPLAQTVSAKVPVATVFQT